jgi:hypothetical protein
MRRELSYPIPASLRRAVVGGACAVMIVLSMAQIATAGQLGWWALDDGSGTTAKDSSGKGNAGTLMNGPTWVAGAFGKAVKFDGVDDYIQIPHNAGLCVTNEVTISVWVNAQRTDGPNASGYQGIVAKGDAPRSYSLYTTASGALHFSTGPSGAYIGSTSSTPLPTQQWVHVAVKVESGQHKYFLNGVAAGVGGANVVLPGTTDVSAVYLGRTAESAHEFQGMIDEVRIYDLALTNQQIQDLVKGIAPSWPKASNPAGATPGVALPSLTWNPGDGAVFHNVYFGTTPNLTAVNLVAPNQPFATFSPPLGLDPGATYYWRVDEVDATGKVTPGDVWNFPPIPLQPYLPKPADGSVGQLPGLVLTWQPGRDAVRYQTFFSTDRLAVVTGATSADKGQVPDAKFDTGALRAFTTYYWRVDAVKTDGTTVPGPVWSFSTADAGPANKIKYEYWLNISGTAVSALTSDPRYPGRPDGSGYVDKFQSPVNWADNYGQRLSGWLKPPQTGEYTFWIAGDDEQQLWLSTDDNPTNVKMIASVTGWTPAFDWDNTGGGAGGPRQKSAPILLVASKKYFIMALGKEGGGGDSTAVAWQGPGLGARAVIDARSVDQFGPQPEQAFDPSPADGALDVPVAPILTWKAGTGALRHQVFFGIDKVAVNAGDRSVDKGIQTATSFVPGVLAPDQTYYWRIDEVQDDGVVVPGPTWVFTCASSVGPLQVYVDGWVRDILDGHLLSTDNGSIYHNVIFEPNVSGYPDRDDDRHIYTPPREEGYYKIQLLLLDETRERGYDVTVQADGYRTDHVRVVDPNANHPRFQFATMKTGARRSTRRDFVLWPASVAEPAPDCRPIYRFQSPDQSRYFFTTHELEMDNLLYDDYPEVGDSWRDPRDPCDWAYNGIAFCAGALDNNAVPIVVYRFESDEPNVPPAYSTSTDGSDLEEPWKSGMAQPVFRVFPDDPNLTGVIRIHRFWSYDSRKGYTYTKEGDLPPTGWGDDKIVWRAYPRPGQ